MGEAAGTPGRGGTARRRASRWRALGVILVLSPQVPSASAAAAPLALLGRQALPVFVLGSVLAFLLQGIKTRTGQDLALDSLMLGTGLLLQLGLAWMKDR